MEYFLELQKELEQYLEQDQIDLVKDAYVFAKEAHQGQTRRTGEPYIIHPVAAAVILAKMRMDYQSIIATVLHDVLEDTNINKFVLVETFGQEIADLVDGVSKLKQIQFSSQAEAQAENFRKMIMAMVKDIRVILVKLADRLHNMRTLYALPTQKQRRISLETLEIYAPIANRLGMHSFYIELEDLCFKALHPMRHKILSHASKEVAGTRMEMLQLIKDTMAVTLKKHEIEDFEIFGRKKHLYSIYKKMQINNTSFKQIMHMYGFRITVPTTDMCYRVMGVIHGLYKPVSKRFKDYIAIPKSNSYQSLHTILFGPFGVPIEVQIRTKNMHQVAEIGIAAHWIYKAYNKQAANEQVLGMDWMKELANMKNSHVNSLDFIESVKVELFPDEVYVFTPKGDIVTLPKNATPVDFAYHVHSDIGNACIAAKINRQFAPLNSRLSNGQTVEITTSQNSRPVETWLNFVCTSKAKNNIKNYIINLQKTESVELGKRMLDQEFTNRDCSLTKISKAKVRGLLDELELDTVDDLYGALGLGHQYPMVIVRRLMEDSLVCLQEETGASTPLAIRGTEGLVVKYAECCRPIPGDLIVGHLRSAYGLEVHFESCKTIAKFRNHPEYYLSLTWGENITGEFKTDLIVQVVEQQRVLAKIAGVISDLDANIDNITVDPRGSHYNAIHLTLSVNNRQHLAMVMRKIRGLKVVTSIIRKKHI